MSYYSNILVAVDIFAQSNVVIEKALNIAKSPKNLSIIYVTVPMVNYQPFGMAYEGDFFNDLCLQSKEKLKEIAQTYAIPSAQIYSPVGNPADEIHTIAQDINADLIVMGTHGRSGLKLLLGSTANGVLHGVKCDVLAVKV
ncbi:universal stress protein [Paraglaciecola sp.]|uniref:universal stress protein n=1 Tax=Paraglaciecola sp. TaxID=1920173 RepID=UPI00273F69A8|nr:universal stress protein [Paraglaciecola sp.]MDP5029457.1 universal stress protein [Paraglaciecola sp.]